MTFSPSTYESAGWEGRALRRSLSAAHTRSVERMTRLLAAARDLANETGSARFTVAQVASRANVSLKSFYRSFAGKDELLLALLEEDSRLGAGLLSEAIAAHEDPVARLQGYIEGLFGLLTHPGAIGYAGVLVREHRRLAEDHPSELSTALAPLVDLLTSTIRAVDRVDAGNRSDASRAAETVFGLLLSGINDVTVGRSNPQEMASWLWQFCWTGLRGDRVRSRKPAHLTGRAHD
jgi:AcrR family transcriptional regulator